jgi:hypothetical protein
MFTQITITGIALSFLIGGVLAFISFYIDAYLTKRNEQKEAYRINQVEAIYQKERQEKKELEIALRYWKNYVNS